MDRHSLYLKARHPSEVEIVAAAFDTNHWPMELHQLRYFCAVAETLSFSRAAEQSHVSQPSLSQQILKLDDELGARLFDRLGRSVRLTDLGKTFLPRARAVLRELEAAKGDVDERKGSVGGSICIGGI